MANVLMEIRTYVCTISALKHSSNRPRMAGTLGIVVPDNISYALELNLQRAALMNLIRSQLCPGEA